MNDGTGIQCLTTLLPVTPNIICSHREKSKNRVEEIRRVYLAITNISEFSDPFWLAITVDVEHSVTTRDLVRMHDRAPSLDESTKTYGQHPVSKTYRAIYFGDLFTTTVATLLSQESKAKRLEDIFVPSARHVMCRGLPLIVMELIFFHVRSPNYEICLHPLLNAGRSKGGAGVLNSGEGTPQSTGWFEVQVIGGPLLHSKKNGDGFVDSKKLERICNAIRDLL
ncbi:unnamed protein product [Schistosoma margrebowiei]|uniref:Uncharacterized protein n=1 Tax=Schistosoma margrebowiei TaxID=48269 RepID=A0A183MVD0_9TREM|nr:unnamed protein product [Schistosoma margrebowiei]